MINWLLTNNQMEGHWCVSVSNTNLDLRKYYRPGIASALGIAGVTLVCLTCILIDIINGFRGRRKPWLPCKYFALNSIALSLLSIAARYPSDRTTLMLSAEDQLCKLSGTVLICISMGFFMPSLGSEKGPEGIRNMAALSILVVSVELNVLAQMFTGVIFSYIIEHFVVLFFMFVLHLMLWTICLDVTHGKGSFNEFKREHFKDKIELRATDQMLDHLEWCYIFGYTSRPQFLLGLVTHSATIGLMCTLCALGLLEATLGTLVFTELKYCDRTYRSGWTMQMVLLIQILTILVGMFGIGFRWLTMVRHFKLEKEAKQKWYYESVYENLYSFPWVLSGTFYFNIFRLMEALLTTTLIKMAKGFEFITNYVLRLSLLLGHTFRIRRGRTERINTPREEHFRDAIHSRGHKMFLDWTLKTAVRDMDDLIGKYKKTPPRDLIQLLLRVPHNPADSFAPALEIFGRLIHRGADHPYWSGYRVSCLSMVVLVRLIDALMPSRSCSLVGALHECFHIVFLIDKSMHAEKVYLIDKSMQAGSDQDEKRLMLAEDLWMCTNFRFHWFYKKLIQPALKSQNQESFDTPLKATLKVLQELMKASEKDKLRGFDLYVLTRVLMMNSDYFNSLDHLYREFEQMFVDMFFYFLGKLPDVIKSHVFDSSVEECAERARTVIKLLCQVQNLEDRIGCFTFDKNVVTLSVRTDR